MKSLYDKAVGYFFLHTFFSPLFPSLFPSSILGVIRLCITRLLFQNISTVSIPTNNRFEYYTECRRSPKALIQDIFYTSCILRELRERETVKILYLYYTQHLYHALLAQGDYDRDPTTGCSPSSTQCFFLFFMFFLLFLFLFSSSFRLLFFFCNSSGYSINTL
jgi:hypothetical protein